MNKGERTRLKILRDAMKFTSVYGLSNVTIGEISKLTNLSRTGVISHFKDKEDMQLAILKYSEEEFILNVVKKSYTENALENLRAYFKNWMNWVDKLEFETKVSCPFIKAIVEYKDREESSVQAYIKDQQSRLLEYIADMVSRCIDQGHFKDDIIAKEFAFKTYSFYLGHNISKNLNSKAEANQLLERLINDLIEESLV